jgi:hypothetical protein
MSPTNPWAQLKQEAAKIRTPLAILREYAALLADSSDGALQGLIQAEGRQLTFLVVVPALGNYRVRLLQLYQNEALYPVVMSKDYTAPGEGNSMECKNNDELNAAIEKYLAGAPVQRIATALLAQAAKP